MGRKSLANERREQILDAFEICIRQHGLEGSSLEKIAEEAGVKRAIIRHYIGNRDDLIEAAVLRIITGYREELVAAIENLPQDELILELLDYLFCADQDEERTHYDILLTALWATQERDAQTHALLLNFYQAFEVLIFDALTHVYAHTKREDRLSVAFSIMCLANDVWSMIALGFDSNRIAYGRSAAEILIQTLGE